MQALSCDWPPSSLCRNRPTHSSCVRCCRRRSFAKSVDQHPLLHATTSHSDVWGSARFGAYTGGATVWPYSNTHLLIIFCSTLMCLSASHKQICTIRKKCSHVLAPVSVRLCVSVYAVPVSVSGRLNPCRFASLLEAVETSVFERLFCTRASA